MSHKKANMTPDGGGLQFSNLHHLIINIIQICKKKKRENLQFETFWIFIKVNQKKIFIKN